MEEFHKQLTEKSPWYKNWHETSHHKWTHWLIFIGIILVVWFSLSGQMKSWTKTSTESGIQVNLATPGAVLALNPQTKTAAIGEVFAVDIMLDTAEQPVDGVDIYSLHYDPTILKVIDDDAKQAGVQIQSGQILSSGGPNMVDEKTGTIKFGQATPGGTNFTGKGVLATIHFQAIGAGSSYLKFDFSFGSTVDTNVAHKGRDQLVRVVDAIYTVTSQ